LTEPDRTSPAANTPGRLVSSRNGCGGDVTHLTGGPSLISAIARGDCEELSAAENRDGLQRLAGFVHDLDLAGHDDEELEVAGTGLDELLPIAMAPARRPSATLQHGELALAELGKGDRL
jgi:hypothetical protein